MKMFARFWQDEAGFVVSSELVLIATLLVLGMIVGLTEVRNAVVQELGDVAQSFGAISQSYTFTGVTGHSSSTAGSVRVDVADFCDEIAQEVAGDEPGCMEVVTAPTAGTGNG